MKFKLHLLGIAAFIAWGNTFLWAQYDPFASVAKYEEFKYQYLDANFEKRFTEAKQEQKLENFLQSTLNDYKKESKDLSQEEQKVQIADILIALKEYHSASLILKEVAKQNIGNRISELALFKLNDILLNHYVLEDSELVRYFNKYSFENLHADIQPMVDYYKTRYYYSSGFKDWAKTSLLKIPQESAWNLRIELDALLYEIQEKALDNPFQKLRDFHAKNESKLGQIDKDKLYIASARFLFEQAEFEKAFKVYEGISSYTARLKGQIILEMAWSKYYSQDFSHAMGLLELLKAPYFNVSLSSERYLLESLIYRQLCYFDNLQIVEKNYLKRFSKAYKAIPKRFDHSRNLILANTALLDEHLASLAQAHFDLEQFTKKYVSLLKKFPLLEKEIEHQKTILQTHLTDEVNQQMPSLLNHFIIAKQEMNYLTYLANLDKMREASNIKSYEAEKIEKFKFDKLFWKNNGEFWLDELNDFRVLIDSRCKETQ
jgi:hypothetical protein